MSVNRMTSVLCDISEQLTGHVPKKLKANLPSECEDLSEEVQDESIECLPSIEDWPHVVATLDSCGLERYFYEYLDQETEYIYTFYKNRTENNLRIKKTKLTKIYNTLKMCKPLNVDMVDEKKPKDSKVLLQWKLDCLELSKKCYENTKKIFKESKCSGNMTNTSLHTNKNISKMKEYIEVIKKSESESESNTTSNRELNEEKIVNV